MVFFGNDLFSVYILKGIKKLLDERHISELRVIISSSPLATAETESDNNDIRNQVQLAERRENKVAKFCQNNQIAFHSWSDLTVKMSEPNADGHFLSGADIGVVASFGVLIPKSVIQLLP